MVMVCEASGAKSCVEAGLNKTTMPGKSATFTLVAKDKKARAMASGRDVVQATWSQKPAEASDLPPVKVKDNGNGRYEIVCLTPCDGLYVLEVSVNGEKLANTLSIDCHSDHGPPFFHFDQAHCQPENTLSPDKLTVTHTGPTKTYSSVLGSTGLRHGQHRWKVKVKHSDRKMNIFLGVADKVKLTERYNHSKSYSWCGSSGERWVMGMYSKRISPFQVNDIIQLDLDCDRHTLKISNLRCQPRESDTIDNLPATNLFPYFLTYFNDESISLI